MTKKNLLETRTITIGKKNIVVDFVSAPPLFTEDQIQKIHKLLTEYRRKGHKPPLWVERSPRDRQPSRRFDPIQEIILATEFFLARRLKIMDAYATKLGPSPTYPKPSKVRQDLIEFQKHSKLLYQIIADMHEESLKVLGLDLSWQDRMEEELFVASNKALVWLKEHGKSHRRYELDARLYFADLIMIYEKVTGRAAGASGRFLKLVTYVLDRIDPNEDIILQSPQALRNRIKAAKDYLKEQELKQQEKAARSKRSHRRKSILTSFQK